MSSRGTAVFSRPNATSRPTVAATTPEPGSCRTSPTGAGAGMRWLAVDGDAAGEVAGVRSLEDPGERAQQRRLARPARADQQHALPRGG